MSSSIKEKQQSIDYVVLDYVVIYDLLNGYLYAFLGTACFRYCFSNFYKENKVFHVDIVLSAYLGEKYYKISYDSLAKLFLINPNESIEHKNAKNLHSDIQTNNIFSEIDKESLINYVVEDRKCFEQDQCSVYKFYDLNLLGSYLYQ